EGYFKKAVEAADNLNPPNKLARIRWRMNLAYAAQAREDYLRALRVYNETFALLSDDKPKDKPVEFFLLRARMETNRGQLYERLGQYDDALEGYNRAIELAEDA